MTTVLYTLPDQQIELEALAATYATVDFFRNYPDVIGEIEGIHLFSYGIYQRLDADADNKGFHFCSNDAMGSEIFSRSYSHAYRMYHVEVKENPNIVDDPDLLMLQQLSYEDAIEATYPQFLKMYKEAEKSDSKFKNAFFSPTPSIGPRVCSMPDCTSEDIQLVATLERKVSGRPLVIRILACDEHYDQVKILCKDDRFLVRFVQNSLKESGFDEEVVGSIASSFAQKEHKRGKITDPLIEKFRIRQRLDDPFFLREVDEQFGKNTRQFVWAYNDSFIDTAKKYRMTPEAVAIAQALPPLLYNDAISFLLQSGMSCVWIEFVEPVQSPRGKIWGFSYAMDSKQHVDYAQHIAPLARWKYELFAKSFIPEPPSHKLGLDAFADDGDARWTTSMLVSFEAENVSSWKFQKNLTQNWTGCMSGECGQGKPICEQCKKVDAWFLSLYVNCLRIVSGEFAENEERDPDQTKTLFPTKNMTVHRKMPKAETGQIWKFKDVDIVHRFSLVSFDVLKRKAKPEPKEHIPRGSWMEKVDPSEILRVRTPIKKIERKLVSPRYHKYIAEHHGSNILPVKAHYRWIPTLVKNLNKIYLAEASYSPFFEEENPPSSC